MIFKVFSFFDTDISSLQTQVVFTLPSTLNTHGEEFFNTSTFAVTEFEYTIGRVDKA